VNLRNVGVRSAQARKRAHGVIRVVENFTVWQGLGQRTAKGIVGGAQGVICADVVRLAFDLTQYIVYPVRRIVDAAVGHAGAASQAFVAACR